MKTSRVILATLLASGFAVMAAGTAAAHDQQVGMAPGMMQGGMNPQTMGQNMMRGDMGPGMMGQGMGPGMMMGSGMMGPGMMHSGTAPGMAGPGDGMRALFGARVVPMMNLSVDDVRGYLDWRLERLGNERLKIGPVSADGATITADIVTVDDSLVQRLKIDRRTGRIDYEN